MRLVDIFLAIFVALVWGLGFVASRLVLDELSPTMMTALRFAIPALPCLFIRKPNVSWPILIGTSLTLFLFQFLAQSYGIAEGVPVGLTSVIVQSQALFTVAFAAILLRETPTRVQIIGISIATIGLLMISGTVGFDFTVGTFAVLMISPVSFAIGNLMLRYASHAPMFDVFVWLYLIPPLPLFLLAMVVDGPQATWHDLTHMSAVGIVSILAIGVVSTSYGYWLWGRLLRKYTAAQVAPFALLVPFVGAAASAIVFHEKFGLLRLSGMLTVVFGIGVMLMSRRTAALSKIAGA